MSKSDLDLDNNSANGDRLSADLQEAAQDPKWEPTSQALKQILHGLASLRLTVALLAMAIFIVLAGTLGQVHREIWDVIHDYFRMNLTDDFGNWGQFMIGSWEIIIPTPMTWIDLDIFFPPSFFAEHQPPDLSPMSSPARIFMSLLMGLGWAALVWLIPLKDKKLQLGIFTAFGLTLALLTWVGPRKTHNIAAQDGGAQLNIDLDVKSVRHFTVTINGETSEAISHDAKPDVIQTVVDQIPGVTKGDYSVTKPTDTTVQVKANTKGENKAALSAVITARPSGFWFPKGWTIGLVMAINLLAAHLIRFKIQSTGARLWGGVGVIALGVLAIIGVISSGTNHDGVFKETFFINIELEWSTIWVLFEFTLALCLVFGVYGYISLWRRTLQNIDPDSTRRSSTVTLRRIVGFGNLVLAGLLIYLIQGGDDTRLGVAGMRILWQLLKATVAALILLGGCVMVFRKRAGVVVLHSGVALVMLSELLVGVAAVESQMQLVEGASVNFVRDIRTIEIAVIDPSDPEKDQVVVIPKRMIQEGELIQDERLPVNIQVDEFFKHSRLVDLTPGGERKNPANQGFGKPTIKSSTVAEPIQGSTGTDNASEVDRASAYVTLYSKTDDGENDRNLGTWLLSQYWVNRDLNEIDQPFTVNGKTYKFSLRFKRTYKPYTLTLTQAKRTNYVGTNKPRDYRSIIHLQDPTRNEDRENVHIWMNNPLRFAGETFYQSGLDSLRPGVNISTLSVVTNDGWMIPYVACMIAAVGMLAHFMIGLLRFLNRDLKGGSRVTANETFEITKTKKGETKKVQSTLDPLHRPSKVPWLTPAISISLVVIIGGYLASKARTPKPSDDGFDFYQAGHIPIAYEGRVKPLDTLARNILRILSNRQEFVDEKDEKQPAVRWLLDLVVRNKASENHRVFRIDYEPLLNTLNLPKRKGHLYSFKEVVLKKAAGQSNADSGRTNGDVLRVQIDRAIQVEDPKKRTMFHKKVLELAKNIQLRSDIEDALINLEIDEEDAFLDLLIGFNGQQDIAKKHEQKGRPLFASQATKEWELLVTIVLRRQLVEFANRHKAKTTSELAEALVKEFHPMLVSFTFERERKRIKQFATARGQTFAETAAQLANQESDEAMITVYKILVDAKPTEKALDLVELLPQPVFEYLYQEEAFGFLKNTQEQFLKKIVTQFTPEDRARLDTLKEDASFSLRFMEVAAERVINILFENKPLSECKDEIPFDKIFAAYDAGNAKEFNDQVSAYLKTVEEYPPEDREKPVSLAKVKFESFFNNAAPFYYLAACYLIAGLLAATSWLACSQPLNRGTFWLLSFLLIVHTAALVGRIYISGRPPVTNLYSSAVFIGWGCVLVALVFERFYDIGIGNLVAAVAGFMTLGVAHLLTTEVANFRGDSFTVMQAVLDTQFWLATHVVCISIGYSTTYVAGFLGAAYVIGGAFTPLLTGNRRKDLLRMIYGTLCFAIFFSFVGTVLGGLWADDSWGRFWGWDTKENGALIIVLWNALVLHARWGGIAKERGLAALAVAGNIAVSWSWFGVNELGIGLHSYGFTEGVLPRLAMFCVSQMLIICIAMIPKEYWWCHIAEQSEAKA